MRDWLTTGPLSSLLPVLMLIPTPFHPRTAPLCQSREWRDWSGYLSASVYEIYHEREYFAIRNAAALIDISPLRKYEISGPQALQAVNRIMTRDIAKCRVGQVMYSPWCDDEGMVIDDGTVTRLGDDHFRITAADPSLRWFQDCSFGLEVEVQEVTADLAALALQGPLATAILERLVARPEDLADLAYYRLLRAEIGGFPLAITRTGYTGDLGYELWVSARYALRLWDSLVSAGQDYGLMPGGILALDMARIEAGYPLIEVDYKSAPKTAIEAQKSSPYELGLGWAVKLVPGNQFVGRAALEEQSKAGWTWAYVGVAVDWTSLERIFAAVDLPPQVTGRASRAAVPVYAGREQVGQITSHTFSPVLKKYIGLGTVYRPYAAPGTKLAMEFTVEYHRQHAAAEVVPLPFYEPPWKKERGRSIGAQE